MTKSNKILLGLAGTVIVVILLGVFFNFPHLEQSNASQTSEDKTLLDLGLVYLPINPQLAAYYDLGVDSGALVTQVTAGGLGSQAGIRTGDVIVSFNGASLDDQTPLLGMMRNCPYGTRITLGIQRDNAFQNLEIIHPLR